MATFEENTRVIRQAIAHIDAQKDPHYTPFFRAMKEYINEAELRLSLRDAKIDRLEKDVARYDATLKDTLCRACVKYGKSRGENKCDCEDDKPWGRYVRREV